MPPVRYSPLQAIIQKFAASSAGSWLLGRVLRYLDRLTLRLSGHRTTLTLILAGLPVMMVTTTGARSGLPRTQPLAPIRDPAEPRRFALIASNFGQHHFPGWYYNLKKNPRAVCASNGLAGSYRAHEASGDEYNRFWAYATDVYFGYRLYRQRAHRRIPIMVMEREDR